MSSLKSGITNDVIIENHAPNTYSKALSRTQKSKVMRLRIAKKKDNYLKSSRVGHRLSND